MEEKWWLQLQNTNGVIKEILECNEGIERFGLELSEEDVFFLVEQRKDSLQQSGRVELGKGILPKLIFQFCDSPYVDPSNFVELLGQLQEIFYEYKNEFMDELSDDDLLECMEKSFNGVCQGSVEYLEDTVLETFARAERGRDEWN